MTSSFTCGPFRSLSSVLARRSRRQDISVRPRVNPPVGLLAALIAAAMMAGGCGESSSSKMVWCVAPGEKVTPELKRDYPELYMPKSQCDKFR